MQAAGSVLLRKRNISVQEVNRLIKQFDEMRQMMKQFSDMMGPKGGKDEAMKQLKVWVKE